MLVLEVNRLRCRNDMTFCHRAVLAVSSVKYQRCSVSVTITNQQQKFLARRFLRTVIGEATAVVQNLVGMIWFPFQSSAKHSYLNCNAFKHAHTLHTYALDCLKPRSGSLDSCNIRIHHTLLITPCATEEIKHVTPKQVGVFH